MKFASVTSTTAILTSVLLSFATAAIAQARPALAEETSASFLAQVTPDGTTSTTVNSTATGVQIENGDRAGGNLFHSFGEFSVPTGSEAYFNNANDIVNIFSRVTGGNFSNIDGLLRANGTANLFLINPAGILFGPNASLQLGGSFFGSTADSIVFPDGEFSATDLENPPSITINAPIGLGFRDESQPIINRSIAVDRTGRFSAGLEVLPGQNISLFGGDINFEGGLMYAPGGRIELGGLSSAGTISLDENFSANFPESIARADINLTNGAIISVVSDGGGFINVNARNLNLAGGSLFVGGIAAGQGTAEAQAGNITINATETVNFDGINSDGIPSGVNNNVEPGAEGNGGIIDLQAKNLSLTNGAQIQTLVRRANPQSELPPGNGVAGNIKIDVTELVSIDGVSEVFQVSEIDNSFVSLISSSLESGATGRSGNIDLKTGDLSLTNGGQIIANTFGNGDAGKITLNINDNLTVENGGLIFSNGQPVSLASGVSSTVGIGAEGNAGEIDIAANNFFLRNGGNINSSTFGQGNAGNITLDINETIALDGINQIQPNSNAFVSGIGSNVEPGAEGNGGIIDLQAKSLSLTNGAQIQTLVRQANPQFELAAGNGVAGNIKIDVAELVSIDGVSEVFQVSEIDNSFVSLISSSLESGATGRSGNINLKAGDLSLTNGGNINSFTGGMGNAGEIDIAANNVLLKNGGNINSSTLGQGNAGNITLDINETIALDGINQIQPNSNAFVSGIVSNVEPGAEGNGGIIDLQAKNLSLTNGAQIQTLVRQANPQFELAAGNGVAGNIKIDVTELVSIDGVSEVFQVSEIDNSFNSLISSSLESGARGRSGNINLKAGDLSLTNGGQIFATTFGNGDAGNVNLNIENNILIQGTTLAFNQGITRLIRSQITSSVEPNAIGNGGDIIIQNSSGNLSLVDRGLISVESQGQGNTGRIFIESNSLNLDRNSVISAATSFSDTDAPEQNISITLADNLTLRENSNISAQAFSNANGGNIDINAELIIAYPSNGNGNDIIASAGEGRGGNIDIQAEALFGIEERQAIKNNGTNDIDATSGIEGLDGTVTINTPDSNPIRDNRELTQNVVASTVKTTDACSVSETGEIETSGLIVKGKGGVPPEPTEPINADNLIVDGETTSDVSQNNNSQNDNVGTIHELSPQNPEEIPSHIQPVAYRDNGEPIYLARGVIVQEDGSVILTAYPIDKKDVRTPQPSGDCRADD
jgi:filamentous hemagglutinin family protein